MGHALSHQCASCHGLYGLSSNEQSPDIAGQKEAYLVDQLKNYQMKLRDNLTMQTITNTLSNQDIQNLAAYYASTSPVAQFDLATRTLVIPYLSISNNMYNVQLHLDSIFPVSLRLTNVENR
jgi:cytochrome c553